MEIQQVILIGGEKVVFPLWISTLEISQTYYYNVQSLFLNGQTHATCGVKRAPMLYTNEACTWMRAFFDLMGDKMPDRTTVYLSSSLTKVHVFKRMVEELESRRKKLQSLKYGRPCSSMLPFQR